MIRRKISKPRTKKAVKRRTVQTSSLDWFRKYAIQRPILKQLQGGQPLKFKKFAYYGYLELNGNLGSPANCASFTRQKFNIPYTAVVSPYFTEGRKEMQRFTMTGIKFEYTPTNLLQLQTDATLAAGKCSLISNPNTYVGWDDNLVATDPTTIAEMQPLRQMEVFRTDAPFRKYFSIHDLNTSELVTNQKNDFDMGGGNLNEWGNIYFITENIVDGNSFVTPPTINSSLGTMKVTTYFKY